MSSFTPRIVCTAMLMDDGEVIAGIRHFSPEMRVTLARIYGKGIRIGRRGKFGFWLKKPYHLRVKTQGFIDQYGKFYSRTEAWVLARKNNQIIRPTGWEKKPVIIDNSKLEDVAELFSENLY